MVLLQHYRDGEVIESIILSKDMFKSLPDGSVYVVFPPGQITFVTQDELHFDPDGLKEIL